MQVPHSKGVANHTVPESCVAYREVSREALTGVQVGQPLSREILSSGVPTYLHMRKATRTGALLRVPAALRGLRPWHACMLLAWEPGDLLLDHLIGVARIGKVRSRSR